MSETPASPQISVVSFPLLVVYHPYSGHGTLAPYRLDQETTQAAGQASPRFPLVPTAPTAVGDHVFGSLIPGRYPLDLPPELPDVHPIAIVSGQQPKLMTITP